MLTTTSMASQLKNLSPKPAVFREIPNYKCQIRARTAAALAWNSNAEQPVLRRRKKGLRANLEKFQRSALQFLSSPSGIAVMVALALAVLLGVYGNSSQGMRVPA